MYKLPVKTMEYPEPGFELHQRQGDTNYRADVHGRGPVLHPRLHLPWRGGGAQDGAMADLESQLPAPQYAVTKLNEKDFWHMFDTSHYELCRQKYRATGTFMSVYYKSKKGRKTEKEVQEAEAAMLEPAYYEEA
uniref:Uncharacterized protein n=1 Tax=Avena sativa TaxID=4498 RepID=A0ACD6AMY2_AVESA